ncbi:MAG: hypothetical protein GVY35_11535 [Bacteroidetes bacterium]|jgi:hypothetical protein|nr:hypothetical protein [Bacteroidota bacterium]
MLSDDTIATLEQHAAACDAARAALEDALDTAEQSGALDDDTLRPVAAALKEWRDAQQGFMDAVAASEAPDVPMAALLLKQTADVDVSNARRGLPGASVDNADQPFDIDMTGMRGQALTTAAMDVLPTLDA